MTNAPIFTASIFTNTNWRVRGRLTFMLAAAADATATPAPGRLLGSRMVSHGGPFTSARTRRTSQVIEQFPRDSPLLVSG